MTRHIKPKHIRKRDSVFGRYPCCDLVNNAIRFVIDDKPKEVVLDELVFAIQKAGGYFHSDNAKRLTEMGIINVEEY